MVDALTAAVLASVTPGGRDDGAWLEQWREAFLENLEDPALLAIARAPVEPPFDVIRPAVIAESAALFVRRVLPYRFTGQEEIVSLRRARARGHGACGDGSAAVAAVGVLCDARGHVNRCYELHPTNRSYAHVAIDVDGVRADPYPDASLEVPRCAVSDDVRELWSTWRVRAKPAR